MKRIALLGYGTVGSGVYEVVEKNIDSVKNKFDVDLSIEDILVRNIDKYSDLPHADKFKTSFEDVLANKPDIVVEVMGGLKPAYDYIKHVSTMVSMSLQQIKTLLQNTDKS